MADDRARVPALAWAIVAAAVPLRLWMALATDLSPDEAYYLCAARMGRAIPDHPPLTLWLLAIGDRWTAAPVELRVRIWALALSAATGVGCVALARARGADRVGCTMAAWVGSWALLPMAGGFVTTPDGPLLLGVVLALLLVDRPVGGLALMVGALAKVVAIPIGALLAAGSRAPRAVRAALVLGPLMALPALAPSLRFQIRHAYGSAGGTWSVVAGVGAVLGAVGAQALLWSPAVLVSGVRGMAALPRSDQALAGGLTALVLASALVRGMPPEPNWWAPAALVMIAGLARVASGHSLRVRRAVIAGVVLPTLLASAHVLRPFLPLPPEVDPTARLHGWSQGSAPQNAPGVGPYGSAAERCVYYTGDCSEIRSYFDEMDVHERSRF